MVVAVVLALAIDLALGEPPSALHPVVWMGKAIALATRVAPLGSRAASLVFGAIVAIAIPVLFAVPACLLARALDPHPLANAIATALLLKPTFALRQLGAAGRSVRDALLADDVSGARARLSALCSRDASSLDARQIVAATVESLAENASDSFVAPLFYFALFGLPGAVAYRAVNTLDAMIGYHGRFEHFGKASARIDDALNFVPARITAALLLAAGAIRNFDAARGFAVLVRDGARTESPNAGRPMSAMAGMLGVELAKADCYRLGDARDALAPEKIDDAWRIVIGAAWMAVVLACAAVEGRHVFA